VLVYIYMCVCVFFFFFCEFFVVRDRPKKNLNIAVNPNENYLDNQRLVQRKMNINSITKRKKESLH
jgi:hypothetical protein